MPDEERTPFEPENAGLNPGHDAEPSGEHDLEMEAPEMEAPEMEALLRSALRRPVPLPPGLTERLTAAVLPRPRRPLWRIAAAAAVALALLCGDEAYRLAQQHQAAQTAAEIAAQVTLALAIAHSAVSESESDAHAQVRDALQTMQANPQITDTGKAER